MKFSNTLLAAIMLLIRVTGHSQALPGMVQSDLGAHQTISNPSPPPEAPTDPEIDRVISIVNSVESKNNYIDKLSPDSNATLPFGLIKQVGATRYVIAIDSMTFFPQGAYFSAYAAIDFPGSTKKLAFRASRIKFNPSGVMAGNESKLFLVSDHLIAISPLVSLRLLGNGENWVEWDCDGFKAIHLVGNFIFNKNKLIPDRSLTADTAVNASFRIYTEDIHNFIAVVNITPFKVQGLQDWSFQVSNAVVDMSELSNSPGMAFPPGYNNPNIPLAHMWTGFFLQSLKVRLPKELSRAGRITEVDVSNLLIDNMGLSGLFQVKNVFAKGEGSMNGWDFSIDEIALGFTCNQLSAGRIRGLIQIPVMDELALQYNASVNYNPLNKNLDYQFQINPLSGIRFNIFSALVDLNNNSSITVMKTQAGFKPTARLNGTIAFDHANFNSNGGQLAFQDLTFVTDAPYITNGIFTLSNINGGKNLAGFFPVAINDISFGLVGGKTVLGFSVTLNLSDETNNSLSIGTNILINGKIETWVQTYGKEKSGGAISFTKTRWEFDRVLINGVGIDIQTSPFTLAGNLIYKEDDAVYGKGFFGTLSMSIKKVMPNPAAVSVAFGSKANYRYFYVDAKIPTSFNLGNIPVKIVTLIGGLYRHMTPNRTSQSEFIALKQNFSGVAGTALNYTPNERAAMGFKAGVGYEFSHNDLPFNGDLMLEIGFTSSGGLGVISLSGDVYSLASVSQRQKAVVKGKIALSYDAENRIFDALAQVNLNAYQLITGIGYLKVHIDPETWYLCVGRPSAPNSINFLNLITAPSYFMVGNHIDPPMPPPAEVAANSAVAAVLGNRDASKLQRAAGICGGARLSSHISRSFNLLLFSVNGGFNFDLGFDMMMTDYGEKATCSGSTEGVGLNGWLAQGSMYLCLNGKVEIVGHYTLPKDCPSSYKTHAFCGDGHCCCVTVNVPCILKENFKYTVFNAGVTGVVSARVPKPLFFESKLNCRYDILGQVSGNFDFGFSFGNNCNPVAN
jgi:hypothetical protein